MNLPLVKPGLQILGKTIPSVASLVKKMMGFADIFSQYPSATGIFDEAEGSKLLDEIFDKLNSATNINANYFMNDIVKPFEGLVNFDNPDHGF